MTDEQLEQTTHGSPSGALNTDSSTSAAATPGEAGGALPPQPSREATLEQERDQFKDLLLRKTAEFDNYRKRTDRERREQADRGIADLLEELLPIVDDFERALNAEAIGDQAQAYRTGVELIYKQMLDLLKRRNVTPFDSVGSDFDPNIHQAVVSEDAPGHRDGEVIAQFRRGYMLGDRLLRAAMVKVARA